MRAPLRVAFFMFAGCTLLSCYQPKYSGPYACDPKRGTADCPEGFQCVDRLCAAPGTTPGKVQNSGCESGGTLLVMAHGARAWSCPGSFSAGDYATLCRNMAGTHVCGQDSRDDELLQLLDCDELEGFYVAHSNISILKSASNSNYDAQCDRPPGAGERALLGCGNTASAVLLNSPDCHALHHALRCPASGAWSCSPEQGLLDAAHDGSIDTTGGTLCCSSDPR